MAQWHRIPDFFIAPDDAKWNVRVSSTRTTLGYIPCKTQAEATDCLREMRKKGHIATLVTPRSMPRE